MPFPNPIIWFAQPGTPFQNLGDIVLQAPKAANQLTGYVMSAGRHAGATGVNNDFNWRFQIPVVNVRVSGYPEF